MCIDPCDDYDFENDKCLNPSCEHYNKKTGECNI